MKTIRKGRVFTAVSALLVLPVGCAPASFEPPRLEAQATIAAQASPTAVVLNAPTPTGEPIAPPPQPADRIQPNPTLTLWVNETSPAHEAALEAMVIDLQTQGIHLEYMLVAPQRLPDLVATAALSNTLPDVIIHPLAHTMGWAERGILDPDAAAQAVERLGTETFAAGVLDLITTAEGLPAAVPSDGWPLLWLYRQDWFDTLNLDRPDDFEKMLTAAEAIYRSPTLSAQTGISSTLLSGLVVPTESDVVRTQKVFEQMAVANGCQLVDEKGEVLILHPDCLDTLDFYRQIINGYSPSDVQTDISALNAYLAGRTGMIATTPETLALLAGLGEGDFRPTCPQCATEERYLADNTGVVTRLTGRQPAAQAANFGNLTLLGITRRADPELTAEFAAYWFAEGYRRWLSVTPERKVPLRPGTADNPTLHLDTWYTLPVEPGGPTLTELYGRELVDQLVADVAPTPRWGFDAGQGALVTRLYEDFVFATLLQEMLSGYFTSSQAVIEAYSRVVDLIPNYAYYIEPATPVSPPATDDPSE